jgi:hypothetical protein
VAPEKKSKTSPSVPPVAIVAAKYGASWRAWPEGQPSLSVTGESQAEAVGRLVVAKARRLGLRVRRQEPD